MKKVYKYGTGEKIPDGAVYLTTVVDNDTLMLGKQIRLVWHYFLIDVEVEETK
jgi:hypothetical protein